MTGGAQLTVTDIEIGLEERYGLKGHDIRYLVPTATGGILGCRNCGHEVLLVVNRYGGWTLDTDRLDEPCQ